MDKEKLAYIAGIVDSSSYISFRKDPRTKNSVYPFIRISAPSERVLNVIKNHYGGSINKGKRKLSLTISHKKLLKLIKDIYPFLVEKKEVADIIIEFYDLRFTRAYEAQRKKELVKKALEIQPFYRKKLLSGNCSILKWLEEA